MRIRRMKAGDEIRVIAPSQSWQQRREREYTRALQRINKLGFRLTFGENIRNIRRFGTASEADRIADLEAAYKNKNVKAIWCLDGGWSANELLPYIDWELIAANPKPLIGYSDITVLLNAIYAKTGQVGSLAPNLATIGSGLYEYSLESLWDTLSGTATQLKPSHQWADYSVKPRRSRPWRVLSEGEAQGVAIGGNLGTFYLLQGTPYQPSFNQDTILLIEDDAEAGTYSAREFDRRLESILQLPGAKNAIKAALVGRFQVESKVTKADVEDIASRKFGKTIPVIADVSFGHTTPQATLPIGGIIKVSAFAKRAQIELIEY